MKSQQTKTHSQQQIVNNFSQIQPLNLEQLDSVVGTGIRVHKASNVTLKRGIIA